MALLDNLLPLDTVLVADLPQAIRDLKTALDVPANKVAVPSSATSTGAVGNYAVSTTYLYLYTGDGTTHTWVRGAVATW